MNRRQLLAGLGAAAAGGGAALGTGAFTSVEADRSVNVSVADEDQAYLALDKLSAASYPNATFVSQNASTGISIDINDATGTEDDGDGVGLDSVYEFDNLFQVKNQGTQDVDLSITTLSDSDFDPDASGLSVEFYDGTDSSTSLDPDTGSSVTISTGNSVNIGLKITTDEPSVDDFDADATVSADAD